MTYRHVPRLHLSFSQESDPYDQDAIFSWKSLSKNRDHNSASRIWFRDLLRRAFPSDSECELSKKAARALGVSDRQVRNWLGCHNDAAWRHVSKVMVIAGAEVILTKIEGRK